MNRNELIAQLAAETSTTRAAVERMVGAVFSAIGDALARGEPAAIARGSGRSPSAAAPRAVAAIPEPESPSTSPPPGRRRSRPRRPFETRSTPSMAQAAARYRPRPATFVAETSNRDDWVSSPVRTHAQMRAELEPLRVRVPCTARCELPATTLLRTAAHIQYRRCYRSAFGHRPPRTGNWNRLEPSADHRTDSSMALYSSQPDAPRRRSEPRGGEKRVWHDCVCGFVTTRSVAEADVRAKDGQAGPRRSLPPSNTRPGQPDPRLSSECDEPTAAVVQRGSNANGGPSHQNRLAGQFTVHRALIHAMGAERSRSHLDWCDSRAVLPRTVERRLHEIERTLEGHGSG